jgi:hypothetical protein
MSSAMVVIINKQALLQETLLFKLVNIDKIERIKYIFQPSCWTPSSYLNQTNLVFGFES